MTIFCPNLAQFRAELLVKWIYKFWSDHKKMLSEYRVNQKICRSELAGI